MRPVSGLAQDTAIGKKGVPPPLTGSKANILASRRRRLYQLECVTYRFNEEMKKRNN